ncbi:MAG: hypothetical protein ACK478_00475, partial [Flavobacteriales bacterium]
FYLTAKMPSEQRIFALFCALAVKKFQNDNEVCELLLQKKISLGLHPNPSYQIIKDSNNQLNSIL